MKKRVLLFTNNLRVSNGVSSYAMNYYREIIKQGIECDFMLTNNIESPYYAEIEAAGGKIYIVPSLKKHYLKACKYIDSVLKERNYDILHCHTVFQSMLALKIGKKNNIPVRILHSHLTKSGEIPVKRFITDIFKPLIIKNANTYFACSEMAGENLFGKRKFTVIYNAVAPEKYLFDSEIREKKRRELNIESKNVVGVVGRVALQKNPYFIVEISERIFAENKNTVVLWIGTGPLSDKIEALVKQKGLDDKIIFLGSRNDVNELYQAMDCFLLPSVFEGLPVSGVEAQIADLPCIFSDTITREVLMNNKSVFVPLDKSADEWAETVLSKTDGDIRRRFTNDEIDEKYNIHKASQRLAELYKTL